jgi:NADH-quinone oxidoreductase subunit C
MEKLLHCLKERFTISHVINQREDLAYVTIPKTEAVMFLTHLRDIEQFTHLAFLTAIDYIEQGIFRLVYMLHNYESHTDIGVYVDLDREDPVMESIHHLWEQAATFQREIKEMFGIDFPGSPRVDEPFILEGWQEIPPMRRDFDTLAYSEKTYFPREGRKTYDPREYMKEKLYPDSLN